MASQNTVQLKKHRELRQVSQTEFLGDPGRVLGDADAGVQTAILGSDGTSIRAIVGLNGCRFLPSPDTDPMDEVLLETLKALQQETK
jgi:hypothetical protein